MIVWYCNERGGRGFEELFLKVVVWGFVVYRFTLGIVVVLWGVVFVVACVSLDVICFSNGFSDLFMVVFME